VNPVGLRRWRAGIVPHFRRGAKPAVRGSAMWRTGRIDGYTGPLVLTGMVLPR